MPEDSMTPEQEMSPSPLDSSSDLLSSAKEIAKIDPFLSYLFVSMQLETHTLQLEIKSLDTSDPEKTQEELIKFAQALESHSRNISLTAQQSLEQAQHGQKMEKLTKTDPLTELPNRTQIEEKLDSVIDLFKRHQSAFSFMFIDLDDFKSINDTHGHHIGDKALIHFSKILSDNIRPSDLVGRISGDEFGLITPETGLEGAEELVNRILDTLKESPLVFEEKTIPLNASIGIISSQDYKNSNVNQLNSQKVMKDADRAMYASKMGKNQP